MMLTCIKFYSHSLRNTCLFICDPSVSLQNLKSLFMVFMCT